MKLTNIKEIEIPNTDDEIIHNAFLKILCDRWEEVKSCTARTIIGVVDVNKENYEEFVKLIYKYLNLKEPAFYDNYPLSLQCGYSKDRDGNTEYSLNLSNDDILFEDAIILNHELKIQPNADAE